MVGLYIALDKSRRTNVNVTEKMLQMTFGVWTCFLVNVRVQLVQTVVILLGIDRSQ